MVPGQTLTLLDDIVAPFSLDRAPVRGRIARVGASVDAILRRHDYPRPVAMLLGEALTLAALVGSLVKVEHRLVVQAQGEGPVPLLVAEYRPAKEGNVSSLRGYARVRDGASLPQTYRIAPRALIGAGTLAIMLEQDAETAAYQGVVPLDGETLAACAERYFATSEQTQTRIQLAVGEVIAGAPLWRAGGLLMQKIAADVTRGDPAEDWSRAGYLAETLRDEELVDPDLAADRLLYRLFHEEGVRMGDAAPLADVCTCNEERLAEVLKQFPPAEVRDLVEPDGLLHARCEFCGRSYQFTPERVLGAQS